MRIKAVLFFVFCLSFAMTIVGIAIQPSTSQVVMTPTATLGMTAANITATTVSLTGSAQTITFTQPSTQIQVIIPSTASGGYLAFAGTPSSSNGAYIPAGIATTIQNMPPLASVKFIADSGTGKMSIIAH